MHIDMVKGDFIFAAWEDGAYEKIEAKQEELLEAGYIEQPVAHDYLNTYIPYHHPDGRQQTVTIMNV